MIFRILDIFFIVFHSLLIILNLFGWIWRKTRRLNLITLTLTGGSWLIVGLIVGTMGYCPLTDWHFKVLTKLGHTNLPDSYVKYLLDRLTGSDLSASLVDSMTLYSLIIAIILSIALNLNDLRKKRKALSM